MSKFLKLFGVFMGAFASVLALAGCSAEQELWQSAREISIKTAQFSSGEQISFLGEKDGEKYFLFAAQQPILQGSGGALQIDKSLEGVQVLLLKAPAYLSGTASSGEPAGSGGEKMQGIFSPHLGQIAAPNDNDIYYFYQIKGRFSGGEMLKFCLHKDAANAECIEVLTGYKSLNYHLEERF